MTNDKNRSDFESRLGLALRSQGEQLDASTLSRLSRARRAAVSEMRDSDGRGRIPWLPLGAAATAVAIVAVALLTDPAPPTADLETRIEPLEDLEIVLAEDSLELMEDWEFYRWLEDVPDVG